MRWMGESPKKRPDTHLLRQMMGQSWNVKANRGKTMSITCTSRGDWGEVGHYSGLNFENSYKIGYFSIA